MHFIPSGSTYRLSGWTCRQRADSVPHNDFHTFTVYILTEVDDGYRLLCFSRLRKCTGIKKGRLLK